MEFLTNEKLTIVGAGGMIGSNMAQTAAMMRLTPNICLQDVYEPALQGVYEEMRHCGFEGMNFTYTTDSAEALKDAKYVISSGGAARKAGMTREDLLKGNAQVAEQLGKDIKAYCPDCKHVVIIFNPADITGLITLIYSGLKPSQVTTLAALDSTRLQSELAKYFKLPQSAVTGCSTFGGHGEQRVIKGGANIINLRGRSSFQSPAYVSVEMIRAAMGGETFRWPAGTYVSTDEFHHIMMAMPVEITKDGCAYRKVEGTPSEMADLAKSYEHLCAMRDEVIGLGVLPPVAEWSKVNPNL